MRKSYQICEEGRPAGSHRRYFVFSSFSTLPLESIAVFSFVVWVFEPDPPVLLGTVDKLTSQLRRQAAC